MQKLKRTGKARPTPLLKQNLRRQFAEIADYFDLDDDERAQRRPPIDHEVFRHPQVVEQILDNQRQKCAYCEQTLQPMTLANVTHYRPLSNAVLSENGYSVIEYYAWFAYEWQNLLIVCDECNSAISAMFPLVGYPVKPMSTWQEAELRERPLLINPYKTTPSEHLMFTHKGEVVARSKEGTATIVIAKLDRPHLNAKRAKSFGELGKLIIENNVSDRLPGALSAYISEGTEFPGASVIFLQNLCRVSEQAPKDMEKRYGDELYRRVGNIVSGMGADEVLSLLNRLHKSNLQFLLVKTELGGFDVPRRPHGGHIANISIRNFKDISSLSLSIHQNLDATPCMMLLGENATGKSSVLQAIKLALSSPEERTSLRLAPANFISEQRSSEIVITLDNDKKYHLSTNQKGEIKADSPSDFLVLGYGARRYFSTHPSFTRKKYLNATLFNPLAMLRDPRDWLGAQESHIFNAIARALRSILALRDDESIVQTRQRELLIKTHDKSVPIEHLSDGYKSLFIMSIDIMRELLSHWDNLEKAEAIVLIDEVETHLHPRWKMRVMASLREAMPKVQFICSTHDPLCLRGMKNGEIRLLQRDSNHEIRVHSELPDITTLRIEQILSSDYFGLSSTEDPEQDYIIRRLAELTGVGEDRLNKAQRSERDTLLERYEGVPYIGSSVDRQILAEALTRHLRLHPDMGIEDRGLAREQSISAIMGVLKRAMSR